VAFAWKTAVGPAIDRATAVSLLDGGALEVRVTDQHWRRELRRSAPMILERLTTMLGAGIVTKITVVHGAGGQARS
jgi:predicted nucleic acid-binding Zn ribbon protein